MLTYRQEKVWFVLMLIGAAAMVMGLVALLSMAFFGCKFAPVAIPVAIVGTVLMVGAGFVWSS